MSAAFVNTVRGFISKFASAPLNGLSNFTFSADFTPGSIGWARTGMDATADSATCEASRKHVVEESVQALFAPRVPVQKTLATSVSK